MPFRPDRLRDRLAAKKLSQTELSKEMHTTQQHISSWIRGQKSPTANKLEQLARLLGVSSDWLLGLTNSPSPRITEADLTEDERRMIQLYRIFGEAGKHQALEEALHERLEHDFALPRRQ